MLMYKVQSNVLPQFYVFINLHFRFSNYQYFEKWNDKFYNYNIVQSTIYVAKTIIKKNTFRNSSHILYPENTQKSLNHRK